MPMLAATSTANSVRHAVRRSTLSIATPEATTSSGSMSVEYRHPKVIRPCQLFHVEINPRYASRAAALRSTNSFQRRSLRRSVPVSLLPLRIATLGLFSLVINLAFFYGVTALVPGVQTVGFLPTVAAAFLVSFATALLTKVAGL